MAEPNRTTRTGGGRARARFWFRVHLWIGWTAAVPFLITMLTGVVLVFEPEVNRLGKPHHFDLEPQGEPMDLIEVLELVEAARPEMFVWLISLPDGPRSAYRIIGHETHADGTRRGGMNAYINPYSGEIVRKFGERGPVEWVLNLHRNLTVGEWGRRVMGTSAILMGITAMVGLWLWWPLRRRTFARVRSRGSALDWHNALGVVACLFLLFLGITGASITWGRFVFPWLDEVRDVQTAFAMPRLEVGDPPPEKGDLVPMSVVTARVVDAVPELELRGIRGTDKPQHPYAFIFGDPETDHAPAALHVVVDPLTGEEHSRFAPDTSDLIGLYRRNLEGLHTGAMFPLSGRMLWLAVAIAATVIIITGLWMSVKLWTRRSKK